MTVPAWRASTVGGGPDVRLPTTLDPVSVEVRIPEFLREQVGGAEVIQVDGATVRGVIADLDRQYPGFADRLLDDSGLRRYINVYVGQQDSRFADGLDTAVTPGERILILPASSGGMFLP